jgi:hypothetical protein
MAIPPCPLACPRFDGPLTYRFEAKLSNGRRILFLDDDPARGVEFLTRNPDAVWVKTAGDCIRALGEPWDEVHLDHDLGGEHFVDHDRDDCGMAVIRWLCAEPRRHLQSSLFVIHTHNPGAALAMMFQLQSMGYIVQERPFGAPLSTRGDRRPAWISRLEDFLARILNH